MTSSIDSSFILTSDVRTYTGRSARAKTLDSVTTLYVDYSGSITIGIAPYPVPTKLNRLRSDLNVNNKNYTGSTVNVNAVRNAWNSYTFPNDAPTVINILEANNVPLGYLADLLGISFAEIKQKLLLALPPITAQLVVFKGMTARTDIRKRTFEDSAVPQIQPNSTVTGTIIASATNDSAPFTNYQYIEFPAVVENLTTSKVTIDFEKSDTSALYRTYVRLVDTNTKTILTTYRLTFSVPPVYYKGTQIEIGEEGLKKPDLYLTYFTRNGDTELFRENIIFPPRKDIYLAGSANYLDLVGIVAGESSTAPSYAQAKIIAIEGGTIPSITIPTTDYPLNQNLGTESKNSFVSIPRNFESASNSITITVELSYWYVDTRIGLYTTTTGLPEPDVKNTFFLKITREPTTSTEVTEEAQSVPANNTVNFNIQTSNYPDGTILFWQAVGNIKSNDFTDNQLSGTVRVKNGLAVIRRTFSSTVSKNNNFKIELKESNTSTTVIASSNNITLGSYNITPSVLNANEGDVVNFSITSQNVSDNTKLFWTTQGSVSSADFSDGRLTGEVTISNSQGQISRSISNDNLKEGNENFYLELRTESFTGQIIATSEVITINGSNIGKEPIVYSEDEQFYEQIPNSPTNPRYIDVRNLPILESELSLIKNEIKSIDEKIGTSNSYMSRIANSFESIAESLRNIDSHQSVIKDLASGTGLHIVGPYEWFNLIYIYKLLVEEGEVLDESDKVDLENQELAYNKVIDYINLLNKLPTTFKKD